MISLDTREDIPLKTGRKTSAWYNCSEDCLGGSKFINISFGTLTFVITIALLLQIYYGDYQVVPHGSVATDSFYCSKIGTSILKKGGNAIDATIASAFCLAVVTPHITSLDAEGQFLIYNHKDRLPPLVLDFNGIHIDNNKQDSLPRLVLGMAIAHQHFGSLSWRELIQPSIEIAKNGFVVSKFLVQAISEAKVEYLYGRLEAGQILPLETLANTLQEISNISKDTINQHIKNIKYSVISESIKLIFYNYNIYVPNSPSAGPILIMILNQLNKYNFTTIHDSFKPEYFYRIAESTKIIYTKTKFYSNYHRGTASNIATIDLNDNYVSLVMGLHQPFGSAELSSGYIIDMRNYTNLSSRLPIIITDSNVICGRRIVLGALGPSEAAQLISSLIIADENVTLALEAPRFHIITNGSIGIEGLHEPSFNEEILKYLEILAKDRLFLKEPYPSSNSVEKIKDNLRSHSDSRGGGIASRF